MSKFFRFLLTVIIVLLVTVTSFYFWASSSTHDVKDYSQLIENNYAGVENKDSVYSIITYNLGYLSGMTNNLAVNRTKHLFDDNLVHVIAELRKLKADIVCLQEIDFNSNRSYYVNQQQELQQLGYNYVFQAVNWDIRYLPFPYFPLSAHFGEVYSGQSILSKYLLKDNERVVLAKVANNPFYREAFYLDRLAQVVKVDMGGRTVVLINVHLEAFDAPTRKRHAEAVANLYKKYQATYPVLLVGDFNSDGSDRNAAVKLIFNLPGIKSAVAINEKTFPASAPGERLDYIFYNEKFIHLKKATVLTSFGQASDHLPLQMEFELK